MGILSHGTVGRAFLPGPPPRANNNRAPHEKLSQTKSNSRKPVRFGQLHAAGPRTWQPAVHQASGSGGPPGIWAPPTIERDGSRARNNRTSGKQSLDGKGTRQPPNAQRPTAWAV